MPAWHRTAAKVPTFTLLTGLLLAAGCSDGMEDPLPEPARAAPVVGNPVPVVGRLDEAEAGRQLADAFGCAACHRIPGIRGHQGQAGPPLNDWAQRGFVAGALPNTPANLVRWLLAPDSIEPGTAMPDLGLTEVQARAVAAYLFTLR